MKRRRPSSSGLYDSDAADYPSSLRGDRESDYRRRSVDINPPGEVRVSKRSRVPSSQYLSEDYEPSIPLSSSHSRHAERDQEKDRDRDRGRGRDRDRERDREREGHRDRDRDRDRDRERERARDRDRDYDRSIEGSSRRSDNRSSKRHQRISPSSVRTPRSASHADLLRDVEEGVRGGDVTVEEEEEEVPVDPKAAKAKASADILASSDHVLPTTFPFKKSQASSWT